jgi:glutamate-1-semialdehyde 2,1-aminomutase
MKVCAIVQARMGSSRLPGKVMKQLAGKPLIEVLLGRLSRSREIDQIVVATTEQNADDALADFVESLGYLCVRGSEADVLSRFAKAATLSKADIVVRITGDCPLIDPELVDETIGAFRRSGLDFLSNAFEPSFPDGLDTAVFYASALHQAAAEATTSYDREHVTPYIRNSGKFKVDGYRSETDYSSYRWTVDEPEDLEVLTSIFSHFAPDIYFGWREVIRLQETSPELFAANQGISRNQGSQMGTGQKLWKRARKVIPGGNMLLSKRAEMFLPDQWPSYFSKAKGCTVWDLDGKAYTDVSIMGIGTNTLGYGHPEVDEAVAGVVANGNMSTLNCPEEVYLAEKLVELHPWFDMVRFARTGGEANAIAIRIARAASGKDKVAFCGYHGWHDWYLAANLGDEKNLAGHLLPGLEPNGVPANLSGSVYPFRYNRFDELEALVAEHDIGVIKMEVSRNAGPQDDFLQKIRKLATDKGIVLIFDESTSGFRETFGGLHKKFDVQPDMAVFGKALGNGYAITAVAGRREIMNAAQSTFISSTFWTERIGPTAGFKVLEVMERERSWEKISSIGASVSQGWKDLAQKHDLKITTGGLPAISSFGFVSLNALVYKTLITQEMLAKGYLAGTLFYASIVHTPEILKDYFEALDPVFGLIAECEAGRDPLTLLKGPVCHNGFARLN